MYTSKKLMIIIKMAFFSIMRFSAFLIMKIITFHITPDGDLKSFTASNICGIITSYLFKI